MSAAKDVLDEFGVASDVQVLSAHRTPEAMIEWGKSARSLGF
jgi:5-(carboxyamino)imidazole ribonucleotide mutase